MPRLSAAFYARVDRDPVLRPLFPGKTFTCAIEEFTAFLVRPGGPGEDTQRRWLAEPARERTCASRSEAERTAWMANMAKALEEVQASEPVRRELLAFFDHSSAYVVNHGNATAEMSAETSRRRDAQQQLDQAVAAIRSGDANRAIELAKMRPSGFAAPAS